MKKTRIAFFFGILCILAGSPLFAQHAEELSSPFFFGFGPVTTTLNAPLASALNPAAAALEQRTRLEANYLALMSFSPSLQWGNAINAGASLPTAFGVLSFSGQFLSSPYAATNLGTYAGLHVAFSKDLYPNFLIGLGVNAAYGSRSGIDDWSLGGDVGVIHNLGDVLFLKDFTWALAFRNMGKGLAPAAGLEYLPKAFTPALGLSFKPVKTDAFTWTVFGDFTFPGFSNFLLFAGTELDFFHVVYARASYHLDAAEAATAASRFPFSFGLSVVVSLDIKDSSGSVGRAMSGSDIAVDAAFAPLGADVYGAGLGVNLAIGSLDRTPPVIALTPARPSGDTAAPDAPVYVSPNLDGVQDNLELAAGITDERYVEGYKLVIRDKSGVVVRTIENKEERAENVDALNVLNRLVYVKHGIVVPGTLRWDGTLDSGSPAGDSEYTYTVEAWDDNGNRTTTSERKVVVDTTPPAAAAKSAYIVFSPNGDGNKDTLPLELAGSAEDSWQASITDAQGKAVKHFEWKNKSPQNLSWDGKDDAGNLAADGVYAFALASQDRAGNSTTRKIENIIINTVATPITLTVNTGYFSPNNDGVKDTVTVSLTVPVNKGIDAWSLTLKNSKRETVRTFSGKDTIPLTFLIDGKADAGAALPEGAYRAGLDVKYANGNNPKAESGDIVLDLTPPAAKIAIDNPVFSPNNDGNKDFVTVGLDTSAEDEWLADIRDAKNSKIVRTWRWKGKPEARLVWGGQGDDGKLLSDGGYQFVISATDRAGNATRSEVQTLTINTEETPLLFTAALAAFSPNNDKVNDSLGLIPQLKVTAGIDSYTILIKDKAGKTARTLSGKKTVPLVLSWDGFSDSGMVAPDGEYTATLQALYANGNNPSAKTAPFTLDTKAPEIALKADYLLFSPDADGRKDSLVIAQKSSAEDLWEGRLTDKVGKTVRNVFWKGQAEALVWDGKDDNGNRLPDGTYAYAVSSTDQAGNKNQAILAGIEIDTTPTPVFVTSAARAFSPNKDGAFDTIDFGLVVENRRGLTGWSLALVHDTLGPERTFRGTTDVPATLAWDGLSDSKQAAPEGAYRAVLTVEYAKGNKPEEKTPSFMLDVTAPAVDLALSPLPFSPDNDGMDDELALGIKVKEATSVTSWKIEITDPEKNHFIGFQGKGTPTDKIIWNGLSDKGELVQAATDYMLAFSIADEVGNAASFTKTVPVDVLVIRDGDKLYIRVPSITFKPDTANYTDVAKEAYDKNLWTLQRLAQIFLKYRSYNILIEGHAVSVFWRDATRAQREQTEELIPLAKSRAEAVKQALVGQGIEAGRISTEGIGAKRPLFPFSDEKNLWKNRRVEFILLKK
jgi:flagellar hook assembly protein FlgD/outer membrane protein OmpA-like peptidoglycan-associated protein